MYTRDLEVTLQIYPVDRFDSIFNVLYFSVFNHTSCGKNNVSGYGVQETNSIDVHEVTADGELLVLIKDAFGDSYYLNRLHILDLAPHCFAF